MRPTVRPLAAVLLSVTLVGLAGCGKAAEKVAEQATERAIEQSAGDGAKVDLGDDGAFEIETEDGSYSAGTGEVPKGWPDDVPLPEGLEIVTGTDLGSDTETISSIVATTDASPDEVAAFFEDALDGWEEANQLTSNGDGASFRSVSYVSGDRTVQLTIGADADGATSLSISHAAKTPA